MEDRNFKRLCWLVSCKHTCLEYKISEFSSLTCKAMAFSGTLAEPPPVPPPSAATLQQLTHLSAEQQAAQLAAESLPVEYSGHTTVSAQATALMPRQSQPTATNCLFPYIDPKSEAQPSPSAVTNNLLPQDLLLSLKRQQGRALNPLSPPRGATKLPPRHGNFSPQSQSQPQLKQPAGANIANRPPANAWNYPHRRTRLRHLTEAPPCVCGAGRDISFLYDLKSLEQERERASRRSGNGTLPNTLVPDEYHIVKHPGVLGLEFHDE